jgi:hypothetical protein
MSTELVTIRTFKTPMEADLAKGALKAADIFAVTSADDAEGLQPGFWASEGVRLIVRAEDVARANEILSAAERT